jgi:hypothetical protein
MKNAKQMQNENEKRAKESARQKRERICANAQINVRSFYKLQSVFDYRDVFSAHNRRALIRECE